MLLFLIGASSCQKTHSSRGAISFRTNLKESGSSTMTTYGEKSVNAQPLQWMRGDIFRAYSPQAVKIYTDSEHSADYKVDGITTDGTTSVTTVLSADDGNGLGWEDGTHYFYAVYPSPILTGFQSTLTEGGKRFVQIVIFIIHATR